MYELYIWCMYIFRFIVILLFLTLFLGTCHCLVYWLSGFDFCIIFSLFGWKGHQQGIFYLCRLPLVGNCEYNAIKLFGLLNSVEMLMFSLKYISRNVIINLNKNQHLILWLLTDNTYYDWLWWQDTTHMARSAPSSWICSTRGVFFCPSCCKYNCLAITFESLIFWKNK